MMSNATLVDSSVNLASFSIIDSTLREGEQFSTAHFNTAQKIKIAQGLDAFGVDYVRLSLSQAMRSETYCVYLTPCIRSS